MLLHLFLLISLAAAQDCAQPPPSQAPYLDTSTGIQHPASLSVAGVHQPYMVLGATRWQNLSVALFVNPIEAAARLGSVRGRSSFEALQPSSHRRSATAPRRRGLNSLFGLLSPSPRILRFVLTEEESVASLQDKFKGNLMERLAFDVPTHTQELLAKFDSLFEGLDPADLKPGAELVFSLNGDDLAIQVAKTRRRVEITNVPFLAQAMWDIFSDDANEGFQLTKWGDRIPLLWLDQVDSARFWLRENRRTPADAGRPDQVELVFAGDDKATQVLVLAGHATQDVESLLDASVDVSLYVEAIFSEALRDLQEPFDMAVPRLVRAQRAVRTLRLQASGEMLSLDMASALSKVLVHYLQAYNTQTAGTPQQPVYDVQATVNQFLRQIPLALSPNDVMYVTLVPEQQLDQRGAALAVLRPNDNKGSGALSPVTGVAAQLLSEAVLAAYLQPVGLLEDAQRLALVAGLLEPNEPVPTDTSDDTSEEAEEEVEGSAPSYLGPVLVLAGGSVVGVLVAGLWPSKKEDSATSAQPDETVDAEAATSEV